MMDTSILIKPINRLKGILATQTGWNTAPTSLANCTDGDWTTATGLAKQTELGQFSVSAGYIAFDMGAIYNVNLRGLVDIRNQDAWSAIILVVRASEDNSTWYSVQPMVGNMGCFLGLGDALTTVTGFINTFCRARYIRFYISNNSAAQDCYMGIHELQAIDLGE